MNLTRIGLDMQIQTVAVIGAGTMGGNSTSLRSERLENQSFRCV